MDNILRRYLKAEHGRSKALADSLSIAPSTLSQWARVPAERVLEVERLTGLSRYDLRPDIYGPAPPARRRPSDARTSP